MIIYLELTRRFNRGRLRAVLAGGQAVVLHRLAVMSKDGDWIVREDAEALSHIRGVLAEYGAQYRFGAPLDIRWLAGGWSAHLEFQHEGMRVRTDFVSRPPRLDAGTVARLWIEHEGKDLPVVGVRELADLKKTNREKDYAVIGELARLIADPDAQMLYSRSARDLMGLAGKHPERIPVLLRQRPLLAMTGRSLPELEAALDAERRRLMRVNENRLARYQAAAERWAAAWRETAEKIEGRGLADAHGIVCRRAEGVLPFLLPGDPP